MNIIICDDEEKERSIIKQYINSFDANNTVIEFESAVLLLNYINEGKHCDILFLDVQMPNIDGWNAAKQLKNINAKIFIIMITIKSDYIYNSFDRVNWFVEKPVTESRIHQILNNAYEKLHPVFIEFYINNTPVILFINEITYIEVNGNYVYINTLNKKYKIRESLKNIIKKHNFSNFISTHQSFLVNLDHYKTVMESQVILTNDVKIPLSRNKNKQFYDALRKHIIKRKSYV